MLAGLYFLPQGTFGRGRSLTDEGFWITQRPLVMLYPPCMYGYPESVSGPIRTGYSTGSRGARRARLGSFLFVDPQLRLVGSLPR